MFCGYFGSVMSNTLDIVFFNWVYYKQQFGYKTVWILCSEIGPLIPPLIFFSVIQLALIYQYLYYQFFSINVN